MDSMTVYVIFITKITFTCIVNALDLNIDEPKSNSILKGNKRFVETRVLISINFLSTFTPKDPSLGRGGGGPRVFIVSLIDHSLSFTQKVSQLQNYTDFRKQEGIEPDLDAFWAVVNDPKYIEYNSGNIQNAVDRLELLRSDLEIS